MSLRKNPPLYAVVHGRSCKNRYLNLGQGRGGNTYIIALMVLSSDEPEYGALGRYLADRGTALGTVVDGIWVWDLAHRETSCKNR